LGCVPFDGAGSWTLGGVGLLVGQQELVDLLHLGEDLVGQRRDLRTPMNRVVIWMMLVDELDDAVLDPVSTAAGPQRKRSVWVAASEDGALYFQTLEHPSLLGAQRSRCPLALQQLAPRRA